MTVVLILGSGPNVMEAKGWRLTGDEELLAINNAWRVRDDWTALIYPHDFDPARLPETIKPGQRYVRDTEFVPVMNRYGGMIYVGGTMAFNAGYWALYHYRPRVIAYLGCDMVYPDTGKTHFYGTGTPDPLRDDITLQSLEAKSARLMLMAARDNCAVVNLSSDQSRLVFPRAQIEELRHQRPMIYSDRLVDHALRHEELVNYRAPDGRYWEIAHLLSPKALRHIDHLWLRAGLESEAA